MIDYRRIIEESAEPDYAEFTSKLIPGKTGIKGVRAPALKKLAKQMVKDDWEGFLEEEPLCYEEELLKGLVIATAPMDTERRIAYTESFLGHIDNWATCDSFCAAWKVPEGDRDRIYGYFASLMDSGECYRMRVSMVFRMDHFIDEGHVRDILQDIVDCTCEEYYCRMGAAWAVSFCYIKFPDITTEYLRMEGMDDWVCNKSIQKIRESYRVTDAQKEFVRSLKRTRIN